MKIFAIGLNKTGTNSLHRALEILGFRSLHWAPFPGSPAERLQAAVRLQRTIRSNLQNQVANPLAEWSHYDAYSDIACVTDLFPRLFEAYPGSKFIYTNRDDEGWLSSRERHVRRNLKSAQAGDYKGRFTKLDKDQWLEEKYSHLEKVERYFLGSRADSFLHFNVFSGDGFEKLCAFLGRPLPDVPFPWANKTNSE